MLPAVQRVNTPPPPQPVFRTRQSRVIHTIHLVERLVLVLLGHIARMKARLLVVYLAQTYPAIFVMGQVLVPNVLRDCVLTRLVLAH